MALRMTWIWCHHPRGLGCTPRGSKKKIKGLRPSDKGQTFQGRIRAEEADEVTSIMKIKAAKGGREEVREGRAEGEERFGKRGGGEGDLG